MNWTQLCKRTDYPKLGYIIYRLRHLGIATRFNGCSFHADHILEVDAERIGDAWNLLSEKLSRKHDTLDDMPDDHPLFSDYADVKPEEQAQKSDRLKN